MRDHGRFNNTFTEYRIEPPAPVSNRTDVFGTAPNRTTTPRFPSLSHLPTPDPPPLEVRKVGGWRWELGVGGGRWSGKWEVGGGREVGGEACGRRWEVGGGRREAGWEVAVRRWEVGGRWVGGGWHRTGPYRQAHHRRKPQAMLTVPNRTVTPMETERKRKRKRERERVRERERKRERERA